MKNIIIAVVTIIFIVICTSIILINNKENIQNNNLSTEELYNTNQSIDKEKTEGVDVSNNIEDSKVFADFQTRIQPVKDYLSEFEKQYGRIDYINGERIISNAKLTKSGDCYIMTVSFISPKLYEKDEIENAVQEAQKNGTYDFEGYTFYKDLDSFLNIYANDEKSGYRGIIEGFVYNDPNTTNSVFVTYEGKMAYFFMPTLDKEKYVLVWVGIPNGAVETTEEEYNIDIILLPDDNIAIDNRDYNWDYSDNDYTKETNLRIEDYYYKSINNEKIVLGSYNTGDEYVYEFKIENTGSTAGYAGLQNAITFENDRIVINLPVQGGL